MVILLQSVSPFGRRRLRDNSLSRGWVNVSLTVGASVASVVVGVVTVVGAGVVVLVVVVDGVVRAAVGLGLVGGGMVGLVVGSCVVVVVGTVATVVVVVVVLVELVGGCMGTQWRDTFLPGTGGRVASVPGQHVSMLRVCTWVCNAHIKGFRNGSRLRPELAAKERSSCWERVLVGLAWLCVVAHGRLTPADRAVLGECSAVGATASVRESSYAISTVSSGSAHHILKPVYVLHLVHLATHEAA